MGPQPELHQSPELGKRDGKLKVVLCRHLAWPSKPAQYVQDFSQAEGAMREKHADQPNSSKA